jgi:hypothetical protein
MGVRWCGDRARRDEAQIHVSHECLGRNLAFYFEPDRVGDPGDDGVSRHSCLAERAETQGVVAFC